jgi:hypothetical protein
MKEGHITRNQQRYLNHLIDRLIRFHQTALSNPKQGSEQIIKYRAFTTISRVRIHCFVFPSLYTHGLIRLVNVCKISLIRAQERPQAQSLRINMSLYPFLSRFLEFSSIILQRLLFKDLKEHRVYIHSVLCELYGELCAPWGGVFQEFPRIIDDAVLISELHLLCFLLEFVLFDLQVRIEQEK